MDVAGAPTDARWIPRCATSGRKEDVRNKGIDTVLTEFTSNRQGPTDPHESTITSGAAATGRTTQQVATVQAN